MKGIVSWFGAALVLGFVTMAVLLSQRLDYESSGIVYGVIVGTVVGVLLFMVGFMVGRMSGQRYARDMNFTSAPPPPEPDTKMPIPAILPVMQIPPQQEQRYSMPLGLGRSSSGVYERTAGDETITAVDWNDL